MKFIENKKLFGKINIIDVIILIFIVVVGVFLYKFIGNNSSVGGNNYSDVNFIVRLEQMPLSMDSYISIGDKIYDNETNTYIGEVVSFEVKEATNILRNYETSEYVEHINKDAKNIYITIKTAVKDIETDLITANNYNIKVGKMLAIRGTSYAGVGYITKIDRNDAVNDAIPEGTSKFTYLIKVEGVSASSKEALSINDKVYDKITDTYIGRIKDIVETPNYQIFETYNGEKKMVEYPGKVNIELTLEVEGKANNGEYLANGLVRTLVGETKVLKTKYLMTSGKVLSIID